MVQAYSRLERVHKFPRTATGPFPSREGNHVRLTTIRSERGKSEGVKGMSGTQLRRANSLSIRARVDRGGEVALVGIPLLTSLVSFAKLSRQCRAKSHQQARVITRSLLMLYTQVLPPEECTFAPWH